MENSILYHRVTTLPEGLGTLEELKRYLGCKFDCEKNTLSHEPSSRRDATLKQVRDKITSLKLLIEYMETNGAPSAQAAIASRAVEICCGDKEIEGYLFAIEKLPGFLTSERKPKVPLRTRLMALVMRPWRSQVPQAGLSPVVS